MVQIGSSSVVHKIKEIIMLKKKTNAQKCQVEIQKVLDKFGCQFDVQMVIGQNRIAPVVSVVDKPKQ